MAQDNMYDVVIVGGGPAGLTAALYLARARYRVLVLEKERFGGQITITEEVVNYPGVASTTGAALAETMRLQAESFGAEFMLAEATALDMEGDVKTVSTTRGDVQCFGVLLATGAHPRRLGFVGEDEFQGRGVAYCATCDGEFFTGKQVFVIGGGFAAAEESVFLTKYASHVTIMMRGDDFSCAESACEGARTNPKITIMPNTEVDEVGGDSKLRFMRYHNNKTGEVGEHLAPEGDTFGVFVLAGYAPATALIDGLAELAPGGYVVTDAHQQTTVPGLYAAGDVCTKSLRQVVTATGEGALAATELERYASEMQKKTGIVPTQPAVAAKPEAAAADAALGDSAATLASDTYLDPAMKPQLDAVFGKTEGSLILELSLDDTPVSQELRGWMEELAAYTDKLEVRIAETPEQDAPCVRLLHPNGTDTGLAFHGVPGGHEFTSFVLGLYNAAGPGQPLDEAARADIAAIDEEKRIQVLVSLSCTNCPDVVVACQRVASLNPLVTADVYDINHFPQLTEEHNVMSVPCVLVNGEVAAFGKKTLPQVLELL